MHTLTLVSHHLCPYVQRAAIALAEKGVAFERVYVDLANRPDWFKAISPLGKVPLLIVRDAGGAETVVFESAVILEYLEETQGHPLHPANPLARARHRAWIEFGSAVLNGIWRFYTAPDEAALAAEAANLAGLFQRVEDELGDGPWFADERFSLVDAVFGPIFRYFDTFDRIGDFGILADKPKLAAWRQRLAGRPSIKDAVTADYPDRLRAFLLERRSALSHRIEAADQKVMEMRVVQPSTPAY
jgi:glutathione S-transferase